METKACSDQRSISLYYPNVGTPTLIYADLSSPLYSVLHHIAFSVVSKWCQATSIFGLYAEEDSLSSHVMTYEGLRSVRGFADW